ncbi:MAG: hypothetical protein QOK43_1896 [Acidimicrobiaceae bacterium]|jgi:hypothetical protein|nr:hypothetical protein [Acidimicrobiaceae bacterium]MDQ1444976.1 hypothetical protein [Acidimicrobiaceae bacterium]
MQATLKRSAVAVLDESGRVVVIFSGEDAHAAAEEWRLAGYHVEPVEAVGPLVLAGGAQ